MANLFMNYVSEALVHENTSGAGKKFFNISVPCAQSKTGFASIAVSAGQVFQTTRRDGSIVDGMKNVLLGDADKTRKVSVATNKKGTSYKNIELTNAAIVEAFEANKTAYREANKAVAVATEE